VDIDAEYKKLEESEMKMFDQNDEVKQLLSSVRTTYKSIKVGNKDIRIRSYMTKPIRKRFLKISKDLSDIESIEQVEEIERRYYPLVAAMCVDAPYNEAKTWQYIDEQEGIIQDITMKILVEVNKADSDIKSFR
jgi:hypothetical protein